MQEIPRVFEGLCKEPRTKNKGSKVFFIKPQLQITFFLSFWWFGFRLVVPPETTPSSSPPPWSPRPPLETGYMQVLPCGASRPYAS